MAGSPYLLLLSSLTVILLMKGTLSATFTLSNNCPYTVWPGILSNAGTAVLETTGFSLAKEEIQTLVTPPSWSGRLWGRTLCSTDPSTGTFACATGDCGSGKVECSGGASPPATLAEFTLAGNGGRDFYDVSVVDGYNLPMVVVPQGSNSCSATGCLVDLNRACPSDLKVIIASESVACKSACDAFGSPEYCCSGAYGNPGTCKPTPYSEFFKNACPRSYSYAYDDASSTFTCSTGTGYDITFCPGTTRQKSEQNQEASAGLPLVNETMVYLSGSEIEEMSIALPRVVPLSSYITALFVGSSLLS